MKGILKLNPYGDELTVIKSECIGHVEERMGSRLRIVRKPHKVFEKSFEKLTTYGLSIQRNISSVENMKEIYWLHFIIFFSTKEANHEYCPKAGANRRKQ